MRRLASLGAAAAQPGASGGADPAAIRQGLCAAWQERQDRRGGDLRSDEPPQGASAVCPDQDRGAAGGADDAGVRDLLVKQRTMLVNAIRGHAAEFGITAAKGPRRSASC